MSTQLQILKTKFVDSNEKTVSAVINYMKNNIGVQTNFYSEIIALLKLYLASPATNSVSERSASAMRRFKNWLRRTCNKKDWIIVCCFQYTKKKPKKCRQCILWSEWREKTYFWYVSWWRLFTVKGLMCRNFLKKSTC